MSVSGYIGKELSSISINCATRNMWLVNLREPGHLVGIIWRPYRGLDLVYLSLKNPAADGFADRHRHRVPGHRAFSALETQTQAGKVFCGGRHTRAVD